MNHQRAHWLRERVLVAVAIALALPLAACEGEAPSAGAPKPPSVEVAAVAVGDVPVIYDFAGTVKSVRRVEIVPRVSGQILERLFAEGKVVQEGDVLYQIDVRPFAAQLDNTKALLQQAEADVGFWAAEVQRYDQAAQTGAVSVEQVEEARTKLANAIAEVAKYEADVRESALDVEYATIQAPLTGRVLQSSLYEGSVASAYESQLTSVVQLDPIHVVFNVTREQMDEVQSLMNQGIAGRDPYTDFVVQVLNADGSTFKYKGNIDFISFLIDPTTDSSTVRAVFDNPIDEQGETLLIPGQYVPVELTVGARKDQLLIPGPAVMEAEAGTLVYVVDQKSNKVESRRIETAGLHDQGWVVTDGLKAGELVITAGHLKVRPGMTVSAAPRDGDGNDDGGSSSDNSGGEQG